MDGLSATCWLGCALGNDVDCGIQRCGPTIELSACLQAVQPTLLELATMYFKRSSLRAVACSLALGLVAQAAMALEPFSVRDIRVEGLKQEPFLLPCRFVWGTPTPMTRPPHPSALCLAWACSKTSGSRRTMACWW